MIDPAIPLQASPGPAPLNPVQTLAGIGQLRQQQQSMQAGDLEIQQRQQQIAAVKRAEVEDQRLRALFAKGVPSAGDLYSTVGPVRGNEILKGLAAFRGEQLKTSKEIRDTVGSMAGGILALPPTMQADAYTLARESLLTRGAQPEDIPEQFPGVEGLKQIQVWAQTPEQQITTQETARGNAAREAQAAATAATAAADKAADNARADKAAIETNRHNVKMENRPVAGASMTAGPGDWSKEGADFLASIPLQWRKTVEKIARYEEDPTKVASMRSGMREQITQWVNQVNPAYDAGLFTNRAPTRKAFTTGTQGQQINAINTAIGHIDQLTDVAEALGNGSFVPGNALWNRVKTTFGGTAPTNFDTLKDALAGEVASVLSKGAGTVSGIADAKEKINAANSPAQLAGYVKTLIPIMGSKLAALDYQYHQAMGESDTFSALSPDVKTILTKHGVDPAHPTIAPDAAGTPLRQPIPGHPGAFAISKDGGKTWTAE